MRARIAHRPGPPVSPLKDVGGGGGGGSTADPYQSKRLATDGQSLNRVAVLCLDIRPAFKIAFNKIRRLP